MSSCKSILVHLRGYQDWSPSIDTAIALASRFQAKLTGLYTMRELAMIKLLLGPKHAALRDVEARDAPYVEAMRTKFTAACAKAGVDARFDVAEGNADELLSFAGRCHDLVVVEQSASGLDHLGRDTAEECAVACGTPTLMVPSLGTYATAGKCVAIAWNHSRQSSAAVHGALRFIQSADRVVVLVGDERDQMSSVTKRPDADIVQYLRLHASSVERKDVGGKGSGTELQAAALASGADLLVMGAYGRSAWREFIFGGTTREVMQQLKLPVLMAH